MAVVLSSRFREVALTRMPRMSEFLEFFFYSPHLAIRIMRFKHFSLLQIRLK
jgi:hypothetical protein